MRNQTKLERVAFVHCWLLHGGAREVLVDLITGIDFVHGRIYTLLSDETSVCVGNKRLDVITVLPSWFSQLLFFFQKQRLPLLSWLFDYRNLMPLYPLLVRILSWKIQKFEADLCMISSFAVAKNIEVKNCRTILYLHSPMQYIHSHYDELVQNLGWVKGLLFRAIASRLKRWDMRERHYDQLFANSSFTAKLAKNIYGLECGVLYPAIAPLFWSHHFCVKTLDYFVYVGRLSNPIREVDHIVRLFNELGQKLIIIGEGPDSKNLKKMASAHILFVGWIDDVQTKISIMSQSRGLINITQESFGLITAESLLLGVPVFGYAGGATLELVDDQSGLLTKSKEHEALVSSFKDFNVKSFDRQHIQARARKLFSSNFSLTLSS